MGFWHHWATFQSTSLWFFLPLWSVFGPLAAFMRSEVKKIMPMLQCKEFWTKTLKWTFLTLYGLAVMLILLTLITSKNINKIMYKLSLTFCLEYLCTQQWLINWIIHQPWYVISITVKSKIVRFIKLLLYFLSNLPMSCYLVTPCFVIYVTNTCQCNFITFNWPLWARNKAGKDVNVMHGGIYIFWSGLKIFLSLLRIFSIVFK